jgi:hypothetical protein
MIVTADPGHGQPTRPHRPSRFAEGRKVLSSVASTANARRISLPAARLAIASAVAALLLLASLHVLSPELDPSWRMVSEYANGRYGWVLSLMFAAWGMSAWALAFSIRSEARTRPVAIGLVFLTLSGVGEAMAAVFDINHEVLHNLAAAVGIPSLPIAAILISVGLGRTEPWRAGRRTLLWAVHLTWVSMVLLAATFVLLVVTFSQLPGGPPAQPPAVLPPGVVGLVGWANRLLVVAYCVWVIAAARGAIKVRSGDTSNPRADSTRSRQTAGHAPGQTAA